MKLPSVSSPIIFFGIVALITGLVFLLPSSLAPLIFPLIILAPFVIGLSVLVWQYRGNLGVLFQPFLASEPLPQEIAPPQLWVKLRPLIWLCELLLISGVVLAATDPFWKSEPDTILGGGEVEWLTSSAYFARQSLAEWGYIPYWQPYFEWGEPLIHNPFAFILNPISTLPELLMGNGQGLKLSVTLNILVAAWGGWVLGQVLKMSSFGRVMLALLMIAKGNLLAMVGAGYFQLGVTQAYFPWIIAAAIHTLRTSDRENRWSPILLALSFTFMFWAGNIWYTLPMLMSIILLAVFHIWDQGRINWTGLRRLMIAGVFTLGLGMVLFLPIWLEQDLIGGHSDDLTGGKIVSLSGVIEQYYNGSYETYVRNQAPGAAHFYYSYVAPLWFWILFFILIPPIPRLLNRDSTRELWRIWLVGAILAVIHTLWGAGGNRVIVWLYQNLLLLAQWRFVGRALAVSAFWLAVIAALRLDGLTQAILNPTFFRRTYPIKPVLLVSFQAICLLGLLMVGYEMNRKSLENWEVWAGTIEAKDWRKDDICLDWLQEHDPDPNLAVYRVGYQEITAFLDRRMRLWNIEADYFPIAQPPTLSYDNIMMTLPPYALAWHPDERKALTQFGYINLADSPNPVDKFHCVWYKEDAPRYAFTLGHDFDFNDYSPLTIDRTTTVTSIDRRPDTIRIWLDPSPTEQILVVQERAYGHDWRVEVNGEKKQLESVGGLLGVKLPPSEETLEIEFAYRPTYLFIGGYITLIVAIIGMLYLGRADQRLRRYLQKSSKIEKNMEAATDV